MSSNKLSLVLIAIGTALIVAAAGLFVVWWQAYSDANGNSDLQTVTGFGALDSLPTAEPEIREDLPPPSTAPIARLVIPKIAVDAPVVTKGVDPSGVMQSPDNAFDTAWYDFSARPGYGGNAVFSGHVDYIDVGRAVFWGLKDLEAGDVIEVRLQDDTVYRYAVSFRQQYDAVTAPVEQIVGPTPSEAITLITCSGTFSSVSGQYDKRLVIRAERIYDGDQPAPQPDVPSALAE